MREYSVGEDNIILEAALISGVHRRHGRQGGFPKVVRKFSKIHQTLCKSRGLAVTRNLMSLKMRMHRLYNFGIMRWGLQSEKKKVPYKQRNQLRTIGTCEQKKTRDYLIKLMFNDQGATLSATPTIETKNEGDISRQARQAVAAARAARQARRAAANGNERSTEQYSVITRAAAKENAGGTEPCSAIAHPHEGDTCPTVVQQIQIGEPREVALNCHVKEGRGNMSIYQVYKENLKTVRELAAMRRESLEFVRREYENHSSFLEKTLAELAEQQKHILQMMETETERK